MNESSRPAASNVQDGRSFSSQLCRRLRAAFPYPSPRFLLVRLSSLLTAVSSAPLGAPWMLLLSPTPLTSKPLPHPPYSSLPSNTRSFALLNPQPRIFVRYPTIRPLHFGLRPAVRAFFSWLDRPPPLSHFFFLSYLFFFNLLFPLGHQLTSTIWRVDVTVA